MLPTQLSFGSFLEAKLEFLEIIQVRFVPPQISAWFVNNLISLVYFKHMSHFAYACKMRCPLNLVLEKSEYLWFY